MHHRTTTCNSNYAGMFVFWDRLFGTYRVEISKQDNYGLAAQPRSFDPLVLNTQHLQRVWNNIRGGKAWWQLLFSRRNTTKWTFDLCALGAPTPTMKSVGEGGKRGYDKVKWNGCKPMSYQVQVWVAAMTAVMLVGLVGLLLHVQNMSISNTVFCSLAALAGLSALARICDQYAGQWKTAVVQSYVSTLLVFYFLSK
jgi:hypothetical protein